MKVLVLVIRGDVATDLYYQLLDGSWVFVAGVQVVS
jgi:hypothetical protein